MELKVFKKKQKQEVGQSFASQRRYILNKSSSFQVQEAYKTLRTNIRFALHGNGCKKFCITSALASEGKSITMLNLAISFAQTGQRVLLVDADLRRPSLARLLVEKASPGLSNVLAGLCTEEEAIRKEMYPSLDVMFSGEIPPNPSELLGGDSMRQFIDRMSAKYDYILVDMPPVGIVSDACVAAEMLDGVLFLVRQNASEKDAVSRSVKQLELAGAKLLGFVLNGAGNEKSKNYKGYKKYGYHYKSYHSYAYGHSEKARNEGGNADD